MEFVIRLAIFSFCAAAVFTIIDVGTDGLLVNEYNDRFLNASETGEPNWNKADNIVGNAEPELYLVFKYLTMGCILSGGCVQVAVVIYLFVRADPNLQLLPKPLRVLLLLTAPILMAPVLVNFYAAFYVFRNAEDDNIKSHIAT